MYKAISIKLKVDQIEKIKKVAEEYSIPYQTLIRLWIAKALQGEER